VYIEIVLDPHNEDLVELIRVRKDQKESIYGEEDGFIVEHIQESRGSEEVLKSWKISCLADYSGDDGQIST